MIYSMSSLVEHIRPAHSAAPPTPGPGTPPRSMSERFRIAISGAVTAVLGLLPHVLHHAGPLAGAALFAGAGGSLLFGALGFIAAIPMLLRLRRRFGNWRAPAAALALFVAIFSISTFVIGPAITGGDSAGSNDSQQVQPGQAAPNSAHESHH